MEAACGAAGAGAVSGTHKGGHSAAAVGALDVCTLCKLHVELDRTEAAREAGYMAGMFRLLHADATAKGDLLAGVPSERMEWAGVHALLR